MQIEEEKLFKSAEDVSNFIECFVENENIILIVLSRSKKCFFYGKQVKLPPQIFDFLVVLALNANKIVSHSALLGEEELLETDKHYSSDRECIVTRVNTIKSKLIKKLKESINKQIEHHRINNESLFARFKEAHGVYEGSKEFIAFQKRVSSTEKIFRDPHSLFESECRKGFKLAIPDDEFVVGI